MKLNAEDFIRYVAVWFVLLAVLLWAYSCARGQEAPRWMTPQITPLKSPKDAATAKGALMSAALVQTNGQPTTATVTANWRNAYIVGSPDFATWSIISTTNTATVQTTSKQFYRGKADGPPSWLIVCDPVPTIAGDEIDVCSFYAVSNGSTNSVGDSFVVAGDTPKLVVTLDPGAYVFFATYGTVNGQTSPASNSDTRTQPFLTTSISQP